MREVGELAEISLAIRAIVRDRGHLLSPVKTHKAKDSFASRAQMREKPELKHHLPLNCQILRFGPTLSPETHIAHIN